MLERITMNRLLADKSTGRPIIIGASCLAAIVFLAVIGPANAQDTNGLLEEVQAMLRQPLPAPPEGVTLPPPKSDQEITEQLRAMLFGNEAAGQETPPATHSSHAPATAPSAAGSTSPAPPQAGAPLVSAQNPLAGQIRIELPPAPPERYAPTTAPAPAAPQARRPATLPDPAVIPLPPHPPEAQAPATQSSPPPPLPGPTAPAQPPSRLDPLVVPLPPHPPEDQAPWRQGG